MRVRFDLPFAAPMTFAVEGEEFSYRGTSVFAEIANLPAGISEEVRKTPDGRFIYLTVVADDEEMSNAYGFHKGFYTARAVDESEAGRIRDSWAVLRPQPSPFG